MSSFDRRGLLAGFAALAGCGFTPAYGPGGTAEGLRGRIEVAQPVDEEGFALVNRLEERLGAPVDPDYRIVAEIRIEEEGVGFLPDGTISRYNVLGRVDWRMLRMTDSSLALSGREQNFTSYSATSTTVATIVAQRDARDRWMVSIADTITIDILARSGEL